MAARKKTPKKKRTRAAAKADSSSNKKAKEEAVAKSAIPKKVAPKKRSFSLEKIARARKKSPKKKRTRAAGEADSSSNKKAKEEAVAKSATPKKTAPKRRSIHLEKTLDWINKLPEVEESEPTKTDDGATSSKCPVTNAKAFVYNRAASFAALIRKPPSATAKVTSSAAVKKEKKKKKIDAKSSSPGEAEASQKIGRVSWFITQCFFVATVLLLGTNIFTFGMWRKAAMEVQGSSCSVKLERQALDHEMRMTEVKETIKILAKQRTELDEHSRSLKKEYDAQNLQQQQRVEELERLHQACSAQLEELERK